MPLTDEFVMQQYLATWPCFAGPVDCDTFITKFMPVDRSAGSVSKVDCDFRGLGSAKTEHAVCKILMSHSKEVFPNYKFVCSTPKDSVAVKEGLRPRIACFRDDFQLTGDPVDEWANMEMLVFFDRKTPGEDPWYLWWPTSRDLEFTDEKDIAKQKSRATLVTYAKILFSRQHRNFIFFFGLFGSILHCFRLDRAGIAWSHQSDLRWDREKNDLAQFLVRFNALSPADRGWDTSVTVATYAEKTLLADAIKTYLDRVRADQVPMLPFIHETLDTSWPTFKVHLEKEVALVGKTCDIIIQRPVAERSSRCYIAYHKQLRRLVFYKDTWTKQWRQYENPVTEGVALDRLIDNKVPHIPNVIYARKRAWVRNHVTQTHLACLGEYLREQDVPTTTRVHVRVVEDLLYPLKYMCSSKQMVKALRNALETMQEAHKAGVIHRDVSDLNIMLTTDGEGVLADWGGAALPLHDQCDRIGSLPQMAISTLRILGTKQCLAHDVETCFWTLVYLSSVYFSSSGLPPIIRQLWDEPKDSWRKGNGGAAKLAFLSAQEPIPWDCGPLATLVEEWRAMLAEHYRPMMKGYLIRDEQIKDAYEAIRLCDEALAKDGWPESDAIHDHPMSRYDKALPPKELDPCVGDLTGLTPEDVDYSKFIVRPREGGKRPARKAGRNGSAKDGANNFADKDAAVGATQQADANSQKPSRKRRKNPEDEREEEEHPSPVPPKRRRTTRQKEGEAAEGDSEEPTDAADESQIPEPIGKGRGARARTKKGSAQHEQATTATQSAHSERTTGQGGRAKSGSRQMKKGADKEATQKPAPRDKAASSKPQKKQPRKGRRTAAR